MASPAASAAKLRSLYRSLLREMPPRPLLTRARSPLHAQLRAEFSQSLEPGPAAAAARLAEQYLAYLQAQRSYTTLLERYNPSLAADQDEAERVRLTARRVGMTLPVEFETETGGGDDSSSSSSSFSGATTTGNAGRDK